MSAPDPSIRGGLAGKIEAAVGFLSRLGGALGAIAVLAAFALVCVAVALRYLFNQPVRWSDEVIGWLIVATVMLSIAEVQRRGGNIGVDLLLDKARGRWRRTLELIGVATVAGSALLLTFQGYETVVFSKMMGVKSNTISWASTWLIELLIPIGAALLLLVSLMQLALLAMGRRPAEFDSESHLSTHE